MPTPRRPKAGDKFDVIQAFDSQVLTQWRAPYTGGHPASIPVGFQFVVDHDPPEAASAVGVHPSSYSYWEERLVPVEDRKDHKYAGYYLVFTFEEIERYCVPVT